MGGLTLITPTGGRPFAFALCERYMQSQTYRGPLQWIVVDDCVPPTPCTMGQEVIRPTPCWNSGQNTQHRNMLAALPRIANDCILVIEDDDYYAPGYLQAMADDLAGADLVGTKFALYYNVALRVYRQHKNSRHSSLCQTGFRSSVLPTLSAVCSDIKQKWIDISLWEQWQGSKLLALPPTPPLSVGIKGLPGRPGIGMGHRASVATNYTRDPTGEKLRTWIGEDMQNYAAYLRLR